MSANKAVSIVRADFPEQVGVSSRLCGLIDDLNDNEMKNKQLMILRDGKVGFESWAHLRSVVPHILFSVSKSVTSTAVGFAIEEGCVVDPA
jgi:CubicO group peptidase (beta-lactamase class C family)